MASLPQLIEEDIRAIDEALMEFIQHSDATAALIIDKGGFLIHKVGQSHAFDSMTLSALAAGSFAATQSLADLVSETNFSAVYQQGENYSLLVENIDENCLLTVIFKAAIGVGVVKYYAGETIKAVARQLQAARERDPDQSLDLSALNLADATPLFRRKAARGAHG